MARRHALLCLFLAVSPSDAATLTGRVVGVTDGDTVTVLERARTRHTVRLAAIDAPEKGQPYVARAKENLSLLLYDQEVRVDWHARDSYGRLIGTVWVVPPDSPCRGRRDCPKTLDAGLAQLTVGLAWHYTQYAHEQDPQQRGQYEFAELEARAKRAGLWRDREPVPPWEWRRSEK
jgi:endonuclease YncB( thermonuclease family)